MIALDGVKPGDPAARPQGMKWHLIVHVPSAGFVAE